MLQAPVYNMEGKELGKQKLPEHLFGVEVNPKVLNEVVVAMNANRRNVVAHTKVRSEVRGGGRKPWRQKGTGRARAGSIRSPLWRGGGITFGPRNVRNFAKKVNKKVRRKALAMALSDKLAGKSVLFVKEMKLQGKTKPVATFLNLVAPKARRVLMVFPRRDEIAERSVRNISSIEVLLADSLNVRDIIKSEVLILPVESLEVIEKTYKQ